MAQDTWTSDLEFAFQQLRRRRGGEPFADPNLEEAYRAAKQRRGEAKPDAEMLQRQLDEQRGA